MNSLSTKRKKKCFPLVPFNRKQSTIDIGFFCTQWTEPHLDLRHLTKGEENQSYVSIEALAEMRERMKRNKALKCP